MSFANANAATTPSEELRLLSPKPNANVLNECLWIAQCMIEGLYDGTKRVWTHDKWVEFLGPECKKKHVQEALDTLCALGAAYKEDADRYGPLCSRKEMVALCKVLSPKFKQESEAFAASMLDRLSGFL